MSTTKKFGSNLTQTTNNNGRAILSYGWYPIVIEAGGETFVCETKYSPTTSRQTTKVVRKLNPRAVVYKTYHEMKEIYRKLNF